MQTAGSAMTDDTGNTPPTVDLDEAARLVEALEHDLARLKSGRGDLDHLRADVEQLRAALASPQPHDEVHGGLAGLREKLHGASDELLSDAIKAGDYIARIGRLLGM
jgi:hypothetical protein